MKFTSNTFNSFSVDTKIGATDTGGGSNMNDLLVRFLIREIELNVINKSKQSGGELNSNIILLVCQNFCSLFGFDYPQQTVMRLLLCSCIFYRVDVMFFIVRLTAHTVWCFRAWRQLIIIHPQIWHGP